MMGGPAHRHDSVWLADIAANLLCIVMVVLATLASQQARPVPITSAEPLAETLFVPLDAQSFVEALRLRLHPGAMPDAARIDLRRDGAHMVSDAGSDAFALVYVFDPEHHSALLTDLRKAGRAWVEIDVPAALQDVAVAEGEGADWAAGFMSLRSIAGQPDRFRRELAQLLAAAPVSSAATATNPMMAPQASGQSMLVARLAALGNLGLCLIFGAVTITIWARGRRAARHR